MWTVCEFSQNKGNENKIKKRTDAKKRKTPGNIEISKILTLMN